MDYTDKLKEGDRFRFEKATVQARRMSKVKILTGSGKHKTHQVVFSHNGLIFIDKSWRSSE